jgi:hypothetical protein
MALDKTTKALTILSGARNIAPHTRVNTVVERSQRGEAEICSGGLQINAEIYGLLLHRVPYRDNTRRIAAIIKIQMKTFPITSHIFRQPFGAGAKRRVITAFAMCRRGQNMCNPPTQFHFCCRTKMRHRCHACVMTNVIDDYLTLQQMLIGTADLKISVIAVRATASISCATLPYFLQERRRRSRATTPATGTDSFWC